VKVARVEYTVPRGEALRAAVWMLWKSLWFQDVRIVVWASNPAMQATAATEEVGPTSAEQAAAPEPHRWTAKEAE